MSLKSFKLQVFFILMKLYNCLYSLFFFFFLRTILLKIANFKVGKRTVVQSVRFFSFGKLMIGDNSIINSGCYLDNRRGIFIGNSVVIAHDSKLYTLGHDYNDPEFKTKGAPIYIEDFAIIFSNALIMPGVRIGKGAVVLSGAVVTRDVESNAVVGGNPAKFIKKREHLHINRPVYKYWFSI
jgi:acetyltransferase-like isoleucine patch superfamily enzyme